MAYVLERSTLNKLEKTVKNTYVTVDQPWTFTEKLY